MKFKIYCGIVFLLVSFKLSAQSSHDSRFAIYQGSIYFTKNNDAEGSPFLYEDWKLGSIVSSDGIIFNNLKLKFDAGADKFLANRNDYGLFFK